MSDLDESLSESYGKLLNRIAEQHLGIDTLETQNSDSLDFHSVAVWQVREALDAAFKAGAELGLTLG